MGNPFKKADTVKVMTIITMIVVVAIAAVVIFRKDRVVLQDENGNEFTGVAGKFLGRPKEDDEEEEKEA